MMAGAIIFMDAGRDIECLSFYSQRPRKKKPATLLAGFNSHERLGDGRRPAQITVTHPSLSVRPSETPAAQTRS
jgi:hypothetical protein